MMKLLGIILLVVGLCLTLYTGFTYITKEEVVELGDLEVTKDDKHTVNWPPYVGIGVMVVGGGLLLLGRKKSLTA
jgi:LPXTG-motif cell wall-anchored protein